MIQSQYTRKKHTKRWLKIKEISILKSRYVLLFSVVTVTIISHHLNRIKARQRQVVRRKHITNQAYKKQLQHQNRGNSLGSAYRHTPEKMPSPRTFPIKNAEQNQKVAPSIVWNAQYT